MSNWWCQRKRERKHQAIKMLSIFTLGFAKSTCFSRIFILTHSRPDAPLLCHSLPTRQPGQSRKIPATKWDLKRRGWKSLWTMHVSHTMHTVCVSCLHCYCNTHTHTHTHTHTLYKMHKLRKLSLSLSLPLSVCIIPR